MELVPAHLLIAWPLLAGALWLIDLRLGRLPLSLTYAYIASLTIIHWPGAFAHAMPWNPFESSANTIAGFEYTTLGLASFVLGAAAVSFRPVQIRPAMARSPSQSRVSSDQGQRWSRALIVTGVMFWIAETTALNGLPSVTSIIAAGKQLLIAGICFECWLAWKAGKLVKLHLLLALSLGFPAYTIITAGFLSFGIQYLLTVMIFVGAFYRPRWLLVLGASAVIYLGISFFVTYLEQRSELRETVWGQHSLEARLDTFIRLFERTEPFDHNNPSHLEQLDARLNQNELVGAAVHYVPSLKDYAYGETLYMALVALVPRALWPEKPVTAGSMGMVSAYTGMIFPDGTSVGIGQAMEFYVNFGVAGVIIGFALFGMMIRSIDLKVATGLVSADWPKTVTWFLVGCSALQPIGQLLEVTSSMAAAAVLATALRSVYVKPASATTPLPRRLP